ncbi:MAG: hypothetical protein ACRDZY_13050 [Acidimicrobiales bacterium]
MGNQLLRSRLAAAVVDRITFGAQIIETGTKSYRLRAAQASRAAQGSAKTGNRTRP